MAQGRGDRNSKEISAIGLDLCLVSHGLSFLSPPKFRKWFYWATYLHNPKIWYVHQMKRKGSKYQCYTADISRVSLVCCYLLLWKNDNAQNISIAIFFLEAISSLIWYTVVIELYTVSLPHQRSTTPQTKPRISCTPDSGAKGPSFDTFFISIAQASKESLFCCRRSQRMLF